MSWGGVYWDATDSMEAVLDLCFKAGLALRYLDGLGQSVNAVEVSDAVEIMLRRSSSSTNVSWGPQGGYQLGKR